MLFYIDGKQQAKTIKGTKREAEKMLREIERQIDQGEYQAQPKKVVTVGDVLKEWLEWTDGRLKRSTRTRYASAVDNWLLPNFGGFALSALGPREIAAICSGWKDRLSEASIKANRDILSAALQYAVRMEMVDRNAASLVNIPLTRERQAPKALENDQISLIIRSAPRFLYGGQAALALLTGMRLGEVCALRWESVDLERSQAEVRIGAYRLNGGEVFIDTPKTKSSKRLIALPEQAVSLLRSLPVEGEYVFGADRPLTPANVSQGVARMLKKLGVGLTMHGLRHAHSSYLNRSGVNPRVVQERLGHSNMSMTGLYTHTLSSQDREAADAFSGIDDAGTMTGA